MGKRTEIDAYRLQTRGGKGVINLKTSEKTGKVVAIKSVVPEDELMVITRNGVINRQRIDEIRVIGRATQGVRLVNLDKKDTVMDVARVIPDPENGEEADGEEAGEEGEGTIDGVTGEGAEGEATVGAKEAHGGEADSAEADDAEGLDASADAEVGDPDVVDPDPEDG
jgi:DNA gyrase subunit A